MPIFKTKFSVSCKHTETIDNTEHPAKELIKPLTPQQMLTRVQNNQPICCHKYDNDQMRFNGRFFSGEKLDVYDSILLEKKRLQKRGAVETLSSTAPADTSQGGSTQNTPQNNTDETKQSGV